MNWKLFLFSIALYQAETLASCFPPSPILFTLCDRHFFFHIFSIMSSPNDKIYTCKNIKSYVSLILDLEGMNYDLWRELFKTNCIRYVVFDHLDDTSNKPADKEMCKVYSINKKLLFCTFLNFIIQADCIASQYRKALKTSFVTIKKPRPWISITNQEILFLEIPQSSSIALRLKQSSTCCQILKH